MIETKIIYQDVSPTGKLLSTYSGANITAYSDYKDILNNEKNETLDITTLEHNMWALSGTRKMFPDNEDTVTWGLVSETISDSNGMFKEEDIPQLIIDFSDLQDSVGITFDFDVIRSEYPSSVEITYYNGENILDSTVYECDNAESFTFVKEVTSYNKVVVKFLSTKLPYRRLRMINIYYGITRIFGHEELQNVGVLEEINPISTDMSINTLEFSVRNTSDIPFMFQKMQSLKVMYGTELMGTYFIDESKRTAVNYYDIDCIDSIGVLDLSNFYGGLYTNKNVIELINELMEDTRLDYSISDDFNSITVSGYIPICTKREALLYICFAIGAVADTSRSEEIVIKPLSHVVTKVFDNENTYQEGSVELTGKVTKVVLTAYSYSKDSSVTDSELFKGVLDKGTHTITFTMPYYNFSVTGATISKSDVNYVELTVNSSQEVVLKGRAYRESQIEYTKSNPTKKASDIENLVSSSSCKLINTNNVNTVLDRLYDYCMLNQSIVAKAVIDNTVSVGNIVEIPTAYNEPVQCRLTRIKLGFGASKLFGDMEGIIT